MDRYWVARRGVSCYRSHGEASSGIGGQRAPVNPVCPSLPRLPKLSRPCLPAWHIWHSTVEASGAHLAVFASCHCAIRACLLARILTPQATRPNPTTRQGHTATRPLGHSANHQVPDSCPIAQCSGHVARCTLLSRSPCSVSPHTPGTPCCPPDSASPRHSSYKTLRRPR
jgi:hypothetical protein